MEKPNDDQINAEIKALEEIKPKVRHYSMFGDNNWEIIEAEIEVLRKRMSVVRAGDVFSDFGTETFIAATNAAYWLEHGIDNDGEASLVAQWKELVGE